MEANEEFINGQILVSFRDYTKKKFGSDGLDKLNLNGEHTDPSPDAHTLAAKIVV